MMKNLPTGSACGDMRGTETGRSRHRRADDPICDECRHAHNKARAKHYAKNREKEKASRAKRYAENRKKEKIKQAKYRAENREKAKAASAKHYAENPEKAKAKVRNRRALKANLPSEDFLSPSDMEGAVCQCPDCDCNVALDDDHIIPISAKEYCPGNVWWNFQPLCGVQEGGNGCNQSKHAGTHCTKHDIENPAECAPDWTDGRAPMQELWVATAMRAQGAEAIKNQDRKDKVLFH